MADIRELYDKMAYLDAYSAHTDIRVKEDPKEAVGGLWEEVGRLQFDFLVAKGLEPDSTLLDIGCGTMRGGRHFIRFLENGHYTGVDISPAAIAASKTLIREEGLEDKTPRLVLNESKRLDFTQFGGEQFDYLLAQSVFTHLPPEFIEECFLNIGKVMHARSAFYFTYFASNSPEQIGPKTFRYPLVLLAKVAAHYGFDLEDCAAAYKHPRDQRMAMIRKTEP